MGRLSVILKLLLLLLLRCGAAAKIGNNPDRTPGPGFDVKRKCAAAEDQRLPERYFDRLLPKQLKPFVIERNDWASQDILVEIARLLLETRNYDVRVQYEPLTGTFKFDRLRDGTTDFNMEIWAEGAFQVDKMMSTLSCNVVTSKRGDLCAASLGGVGYQGQSGWYLSVPALRAAGLDPPRMRFYEALREGKAINSLARTSAFASSLIGDGVFRSGDCDATAARDCATLLKPTESYTALLVEQQIRGGGMNLTISHVGWSQMDLVAASTAPVLFYWWEPDVHIQDATYLRVMLDDVSHCNVSRASFPTYIPDGLPCDFPLQPLVKGGNRRKLLVEEPWGIVSSISMPPTDMDTLLGAIANEGITAQEAACRWLEGHKSTWHAWLDKSAKLGHTRLRPSFQSLLLYALLLGATLLYFFEPSLPAWAGGGVAWANLTVLDRCIDAFCCIGGLFRGGGGDLLFAKWRSRPEEKLQLRSVGGSNGTSKGFYGGDGVRFVSARFYVREDKAFAEVTLSRSGDVDTYVTAEVETEDSTAVAGLHYYRTVQTIEFKATQRFQVVKVPLKNDPFWNPARSFTCKLVEVTGARPVRPTRCSVVIINDDAYPGSVGGIAGADGNDDDDDDTHHHPQRATGRILAFVKWQWALNRRPNYSWAFQKFFGSVCSAIVIPQLQILWLTRAVEDSDLLVGIEVATWQLFLFAARQMLGYWYSSEWGIRDDTIQNLALKLLELPHEMQYDSALVAEITKLAEDAAELAQSTYTAILGLGCSLLDLLLVILFLVLPQPIGVYDPVEEKDGWKVPVYALVFLFLLLGMVFATSRDGTTLVEDFISSTHERHLAWERLLGDRLLTMNAQLEGKAVSELRDKIKYERDKQWKLLVNRDSVYQQARWVVEIILFVLYAALPAFLVLRIAGINVAKALAIISAIKSLPATLISILRTLQSLAGGAVQLRQYSDIFNLKTSNQEREKQLAKKIQFLKERGLDKKSTNVLAWQRLKHEAVHPGWTKPEPIRKRVDGQSSTLASSLSSIYSMSFSPTTKKNKKSTSGGSSSSSSSSRSSSNSRSSNAKVFPGDGGDGRNNKNKIKKNKAAKTETLTTTATSFKGNYATTITTVVTTVSDYVERRFLRDCTLDLQHNDQEVALGGVVGILYPTEIPFKMIVSFQRLLAGITTPMEGLIYLPPQARVLAVPDVPTVIPGTLMKNLRYACGEAKPPTKATKEGGGNDGTQPGEVPTDAEIAQVCRACGLHAQLVNMVLSSADQEDGEDGEMKEEKEEEPPSARKNAWGTQQQGDKDEDEEGGGAAAEAPVELTGTGGELDDFDADLLMLVQMLLCLPDVLVLLNTGHLCSEPEHFVRLVAALRAFCRVETAPDLSLLPAATAVFVQRAEAAIAKNSSSNNGSVRGGGSSGGSVEGEQQLRDALAEVAEDVEEFLPPCGSAEAAAVERLLAREPRRSVIMPCRGNEADLLHALGVPKDKVMSYDNGDNGGDDDGDDGDAVASFLSDDDGAAAAWSGSAVTAAAAPSPASPGKSSASSARKGRDSSLYEPGGRGRSPSPSKSKIKRSASSPTPPGRVRQQQQGKRYSSSGGSGGSGGSGSGDSTVVLAASAGVPKGGGTGGVEEMEMTSSELMRHLGLQQRILPVVPDEPDDGTRAL